MAKRKTLLGFLTLALAAVMSLFGLVACGEKNDTSDDVAKPGAYEVTFMARENGNGNWAEVTREKSNEEGVVVLPELEAVPGYSFRGWFLEEACENAFDETKVMADTTVYAFLSDKVLTVSIKKSVDNVEVLEEQTVAGLTEIETKQKAEAEKVNLTFDGFYTNESCTTKFTAESGATTVYSRYVATITYDNGYEVLATTKVVPGETVKKPELDDTFIKNYMAQDDIYFVDEKGEDFLFYQKPVEVNTTIKVLWKTPGFKYKILPGATSTYSFDDTETRDFPYPVISIPSRITVEDKYGTKSEGRVIEMDGQLINFFKDSKKVIINEGMKYIHDMTAGVTTLKIEEIVLPSSLEILEDSFNGFQVEGMNLKKIELPEGLKVINNCFWADYVPSSVNTAPRGNSYNFEVKIPSTVVNVVSVPASVVFAEGSNFVTDKASNRVYKVEEGKKILVSEVQANVVEGVLSIPSDVTGIQVGIFDDIDYDIMNIPASFVEVGYNADKNEYPYYTGRVLTNMQRLSNPTSYSAGMDSRAYAIVSDLKSHQFIKFDTVGYPEGMNKYAFIDGRTTFDRLPETKVAFVGEVKEGQIKVEYKLVNEKLPKYNTVIKADLDINSVIDEQKIKDVVLSDPAIAEYADLVVIIATNQFGEKFEYGQKNCNQYINIDFKFDVKGFTTIENEEGLVVNGFDASTAMNINGTYLVDIIDEIGGKKIVAIAPNAFKDNNLISQVFIGKNVKTIGENAFANTSNLENVIVKPGSALETIGAHAFEFAGAVKDGESGKYVVNDKLTGKQLHMEFPLKNIKEIAPYAFRTPSIKTFTAVAGEEKRILLDWGTPAENLTANAFYYQCDSNGGINGIVKYRETKIEQNIDPNKEDGSKMDVTVFHADFIACCGGSDTTGSSYVLGSQSRQYAWTPERAKYTVAVNVKEGSMYFLPGYNEILLTYVTHIDANAFTMMINDRVNSYQNTAHDIWMDQKLIDTQDSSIFDAKWWQGGKYPGKIEPYV